MLEAYEVQSPLLAARVSSEVAVHASAQPEPQPRAQRSMTHLEDRHNGRAAATAQLNNVHGRILSHELRERERHVAALLEELRGAVRRVEGLPVAIRQWRVLAGLLRRCGRLHGRGTFDATQVPLSSCASCSKVCVFVQARHNLNARC